MLKFSELQNLSGAELLSKVEPVSAKLVPELVSKGILNANGVTKIKGDRTFDYTVKDDKLFYKDNGMEGQDYVIGLIENGFKVVDVASETCSVIEIESIEDNTINCTNAFVFLCQVDMFDME